MNDQDLERRLRNERGRLEEGYVAAQLPADLDHPVGHKGASPLVRLAVIVPAAAAGVLVVAVAGAMLSGGPAPIPGSGTSPTPLASANTSADEPLACGAQDLSYDVEPWSGAAGSRGTVVTVSLAEGHSACVTSTGTWGRIADADGEILVSAIKTLQGRPNEVIDPGVAFTIGIAWSNWCGQPPAMPLSLVIGGLGDDSQPLGYVHQLDDSPDPVPPCLGENEPSNLSVTDLQPAP